jgi:hypothetical protein
MKKLIPILVFAIALSSCARTYHAINPAVWNYDNSKVIADNVIISYRYDVQNAVQNKPYARKETKKNLKLLAIRIENNSKSPIQFKKENFVIKTNNGRDIKIVDPLLYTKKIRQYSETFVLFYGLAGIGYQWGEINGESYSQFTYNFIPLIIGVGNAIFGEISNGKQKEEILEKQIFDKTILPGERFYGIITIEEVSFPELNFFYYQ